MLIEPNRLSESLETWGFHLWLSDHKSGEFRWSRPSSVAELFEHIWLTIYGEKKNVVGSFSAVSVIAGPEPCEGLYVDEYHEDLCSEKRVFKEPGGRVVRDYHSIIRNTTQALAWETQLVEIGPSRSRKLALEEGRRLLEISQEARDAARQYLRLIRKVSSERNLEYLAQYLWQKMSKEQRNEAERLSDAVVGRITFLFPYQVASYSIVLVSRELNNSDLCSDKEYSQALLWRTSILADLLLRESVAVATS